MTNDDNNNNDNNNNDNNNNNNNDNNNNNNFFDFEAFLQVSISLQIKVELKKRIQFYNFKISNGKIKSHMHNQATPVFFI